MDLSYGVLSTGKHQIFSSSKSCPSYHSEKFLLGGGWERNWAKGWLMIAPGSRHSLPRHKRPSLNVDSFKIGFFHAFAMLLSGFLRRLIIGQRRCVHSINDITSQSWSASWSGKISSNQRPPHAASSTYRHLGNISITLDTVACVPIRAASSVMM